MDMAEKTMFEASMLIRESRALQYQLRSILEQTFLNNIECPISRRLEARFVLEGLSETTAVLAEIFGLPAYSREQSVAQNVPRRRRRRSVLKRG